MRAAASKWIVAIAVIVILAAAGTYVYFSRHVKPEIQPAPVEVPKTSEKTGPVISVIGTSVQGRDIKAYAYGTGDTHLMFVGGVHGGYEWNSVVLAYMFMDYLNVHPGLIPKNLMVTVIPDANPDGVFKVTGKEDPITTADIPAKVNTVPGRLNADNVDLNRNFDCKWQPKSTWQNKTESAGTAPFSEPEAAAIRDFVAKDKPVAGIFWHSQSGNVYASRCLEGTLPETLMLMNTYAHAAGYGAVEKFTAYETTGDAEGWMASINIPAITVEMTTHASPEWEKNLAGIKAVLHYYSSKQATP